MPSASSSLKPPCSITMSKAWISGPLLRNRAATIGLPPYDASPFVLPVMAEFDPVTPFLARVDLVAVNRLDLAPVEDFREALDRPLNAIRHIESGHGSRVDEKPQCRDPAIAF